MEKIVSKFQIEMSYGRPVIKMLDASSPITESVIELESNSLSDNVDQILSYVYEEHMAFSEGFAPIKSGNLWGYINLTLKVALAPQYNEVFPVSEGFTLGLKEGKYYYWKMTANPRDQWNDNGYEEASPFCNGRALVKRNGLYGYLSNTIKNKEEIPCQYEKAFSFDPCYPYAVVMVDGKYGMINKSGDIVLKPMFDTYSTYDRYDFNRKVHYNATIGAVYYKLKPDGTYEEVK
jgi:hypothetical protein